ncbi:hypothetical protein DM02DRAFT_609200 [Periconia macrospinosa]|uniref:Uncharacterized protein n=1 Tax=Periconia macrospinosa TaxID=97972 RepID=A0A2V1E9D5_9PLEO|nr:hypothetical protein DM02DRAFT_609200 [Periconia macrospinosa]
MWQMVRGWEVQHLDPLKDISAKYPTLALATHLQGLGYQAAVNEPWNLLTPRYNRIGSPAFSEGC